MTDTLSAQQHARLARLHYGPTRYEAILTLSGGRRLLVGYSARRSRTGLLNMIQRNGAAILALMPDLTDEHRMTWRTGGFDFGNGARVEWSGRTQRDALMATELPFVGGAAP